MIERIWRGRATLENAPKYQKHVTEVVFPELPKISGFLGARLLRREVAGGIEFLAVTSWESLDAIRGFAGDKVETAIVEPAARAVLSEFDEFATHYEVAYQKYPDDEELAEQSLQDLKGTKSLSEVRRDLGLDR